MDEGAWLEEVSLLVVKLHSLRNDIATVSQRLQIAHLAYQWVGSNFGQIYIKSGQLAQRSDSAACHFHLAELLNSQQRFDVMADLELLMMKFKTIETPLKELAPDTFPGD